MISTYENVGGILSCISDELEQVRMSVDSYIASISRKGKLGELVSNLNPGGGKMLRPGVLLLAGRCCGEISEKHIKTAAVVELMHQATLLHDDVIDEGLVRRGVATINSLSGNESAVLLGDYLLSLVMRKCTELGTEVLDSVGDMAGRTCEGELRQVLERDNWAMSEGEYLEIIEGKSAAMFGHCGRIGAILAGADQQRAEAFYNYGINLGIAFQMTDDLLDIVADEKQTGKTSGRDIEKHKPTLAYIHLLRVVEDRDGTVRQITAERQNGNIRGLLDKYGSIDYAREQAADRVGQAVKYLYELEESKYRKSLEGLAGYVAERMN